ncbi:MAG: acyl-CoA dehydrogenase family protein [Longimicrobiales bacterium]|nr:acyl-CoA dehydrogenase family protein [Longimicrobiales bacterium]
MSEQRGSLASEVESREVAEAAREEEWSSHSFSKQLFAGRLALDILEAPAGRDPEEVARAGDFHRRLRDFTREHIDGDAFDREGWVPDEVLEGLAAIGAFGMKIPVEYGGLGLSQIAYNRALEIVASRCGSTGAFLSAHQSIGVPGPVKMFGTKAQKETFLPRLAKGALSAFALTEPEVGSDPANMATTARLSEDGTEWILNGEKLWCTNGPRAEIIIVMARTPAREGVRGRRPISAFIVEMDTPGIEVAHLSRFMGLKALSNGVIRFTDVRIPHDNLLWDEGKGLKLALMTLNVGRLSLPAFCSATGKLSLEMCRDWAARRVQWGQPVGRHDAIAQKLGTMAANTFAMDSVVELTSRMADSGSADIRLEAAFAKMWNTEVAWTLANEALQVRGGRGYETHDSLKARGESPYPVERMVRDLRINLIFEGSSEIMRLFIAREAVDDHLRVAGDLVDPRAPLGRRAAAAVRAAFFYAWWYPTRWLGWSFWPRYAAYGRLARHLRFVDRASRRLARNTFHAMMRFGPGLEKRQAVLGRLVEAGAELFVMSTACVRARELVRANPGDRSPEELADVFCRQARRRVKASFRSLFRNDDTRTYRTAQRLMEGRYAWLEEGVVSLAETYGSAGGQPEPASTEASAASN